MSEINKYLELAKQYSKRKKTRKKAIECWEKILEINPNYIVSWIMMGKNYEKLKQADKAMECYDKALEIEPTHRDALRYKEQLLNPQTRESEIGDNETKIFEITQFKYVDKHKFARFTCTNEKIDIMFPVRYYKSSHRRQIIIKWSDIDTIKITKTVEYIGKTKFRKKSEVWAPNTYWFEFIDKVRISSSTLKYFSSGRNNLYKT